MIEQHRLAKDRGGIKECVRGRNKIGLPPPCEQLPERSCRSSLSLKHGRGRDLKSGQEQIHDAAKAIRESATELPNIPDGAQNHKLVTSIDGSYLLTYTLSNHLIADLSSQECRLAEAAGLGPCQIAHKNMKNGRPMHYIHFFLDNQYTYYAHLHSHPYYMDGCQWANPGRA